MPRNGAKPQRDHPNPTELTERMMNLIPHQYPTEAAIQATSSLLTEIICRRYPTLDMQIAFLRRLFEMLEVGVRRRDMLGRRMSEIEAELKGQGKPVLAVLQAEIKEAASAPQLKQ